MSACPWASVPVDSLPHAATLHTCCEPSEIIFFVPLHCCCIVFNIHGFSPRRLILRIFLLQKRYIFIIVICHVQESTEGPGSPLPVQAS